MGDINSAGHIQTQIISKGSKSPLWSVRKSGQVYLYTYAQATNAIRKINFFVLRKVFQHPVLTMQLLAVHLFMGSFLRETWFCCQAYLHKKSNTLKHLRMVGFFPPFLLMFFYCEECKRTTEHCFGKCYDCFCDNN